MIITMIIREVPKGVSSERRDLSNEWTILLLKTIMMVN